MTEVNVATQEAVPPSDPDNDYWNALVDEKLGADFLDVTPRFLQGRRQRGDGPRFIRISARCIKYRRIDLKAYADARLRNSTSDPGGAAT